MKTKSSSCDLGRPLRGLILHPTDYSEPSHQAFELACRLALDRGSRLMVMHVAEPVRVSSLGMALLPPLPKGYRGAWESRLRLLRPADSKVQVEYRLEEGDVVAAILRVACEESCDLIVMGSRERTWFRRLFMGSVTRELEHKAPCPVLALKTQQSGDVFATVSGALPERGPILRPSDFLHQSCHGFKLARSLAREKAVT